MQPIAIMSWSTISAGQNTHAAAQTNPMNAGEARVPGRPNYFGCYESRQVIIWREFARAADAADTIVTSSADARFFR